MRKTLFFMALAALLTACGGGTSTADTTSAEKNDISPSNEVCQNMDVYTFPGDCKADEPDDLAAYFDSLLTQCKVPIWVHGGGREDSARLAKEAYELARYARGERKFFPDKEVRDVLDILAFGIGYEHNHGPMDGDTVFSNEVFFFRFLEQAARLAPKVDFVTSFHAADGDAGILYYHEWSPNPLYSFLIYPKTQGFGVQMVGERGDVEITKLFTLKDSEGRTYYLCSNNDNNVYFAQYVYLREGDSVKPVASTRSMLCSEGDHYYEAIVFSPQRLCWEYCTMKDGIYHRVDGSPAMKLVLDGAKTRFEVD